MVKTAQKESKEESKVKMGRPKGRLNDETILRRKLEERRKEVAAQATQPENQLAIEARRKRHNETRRKNEIIRAFCQNPLLWGMYFCPDHFRIKSAPFHLKIIQEALKHRFFAVAAPRESSKTTLLSWLYPSHCIFFEKKKFIIIVSNTYKKAAISLDNIKKEFKENQELIKTLPLSIIRDAEGDSIIRHPDGFECRILCKGVDQIGSIRGEIFGAYRPDLLIIDDIEDDELVKNPERRIDLRNKIDEALLPAVDKTTGQVLVIGTILHDDSQMAKFVSLRHYREFRKLLFRARYFIEGKYISLWNEKWSIEELNKIEKEKPGVFAKEYQNDPASGPTTRFKKEDFRYWSLENNNVILYGEYNQAISRYQLVDCKAAIACDLAWDEKRENDSSVIMPGFLTPHSEILVDTYVCKKGMRPGEIEEILFSMEERLRKITGSSIPIGFEKAKLEKVMKWLLRSAMRKRNHYLIFKDLMWDADKITRIVTRLQPRYSQHVIYHRSGMGDLEYQLLRFPSGIHDDLADSLQGLVQLLNYPKEGRKQEVSETEFDWWRKQAIEAKNPKRGRFIFGNRGRWSGIPSTVSFR